MEGGGAREEGEREGMEYEVMFIICILAIAVTHHTDCKGYMYMIHTCTCTSV